MKCINCGAEISNQFKFCYECGTSQLESKICPVCNTILSKKMNFCFNCGYHFVKDILKNPEINTLNAGTKNVFAENVVGHKEDYNVNGNATFIRNEDETKKVVECNVCGKNVPIINTHTCPVCKKTVCGNCYDYVDKMCNVCKFNNKLKSENKYRQILKNTISNGGIDLGKRRTLEELQKTLGLSSNCARTIENEVKSRNNNPTDIITTIEKLNMEDALELFYEKGNVKGAYDLISPVYEKHKYNEKVLDLYLSILEEYDSNKALDIINSLNLDMLTNYLVKIDIYTKTDLSEAENVLNAAEKIWQNNFLLKCRRVNWLYKVYQATGRKMFLDKLVYIVNILSEPGSKLERTWKTRAENIRDIAIGCIRNNISINNTSLPFLTEDYCRRKGLYSGFANSSIFVIEHTSLTDNPVLLGKGTDGTAGTNGAYVLFGDWPQSVKADNVQIDESRTYNVNGWNCYKGSDGYYYIKEMAKSCKDKCCFNNGNIIINGNSYYFKLESIKWRILDNNYGGGKLLLAENVLMAGYFYANGEGSRTIHNKTIYPNNYEYSRVRAYLNGLDGTLYNVPDFTESGFINMAFSKIAKERIKTVSIDNGRNTILGRGEEIDEDAAPANYVCNNTQDKIFLLSEMEITCEKYDFAVYNEYIGDDIRTKKSIRVRKSSDYAKFMGSSSGNNYRDNDKLKDNCWFWLRSPYCILSNLVRIADNSGDANHGEFVNRASGGIVPALSVLF